VYLDAYKAQNLEGAYWENGMPIGASVPIFEMPPQQFFHVIHAKLLGAYHGRKDSEHFLY
jgi:hypothetical protein